MQQPLLSFATSDTEAGFRLAGLELYNWGTFHRKVWSIEPGGHNGLLTGDIGSGKSTIVDALLTLLVPQQKLIYNKAAGAESRERTLRSYVRGEYKSEKDDLTQGAKAVCLRNEGQYTILLARFSNTGYGQEVTLAQIFHLKDDQSVPDRFFVVAECRLSVSRDFTGFGNDLTGLRKQLRSKEKVRLFTSFKEYSLRFRHLFGIQNSQALNLFYQTVSMKSVGNLTDFVRLHMLEQNDIQAQVDELRVNFDNLTRAHEAVRKARKRIEELRPLCADLTKLNGTIEKINSLRSCRNGLENYFKSIRVELLDTRIKGLNEKMTLLAGRLTTLERELGSLRDDETALHAAINEHGGSRLEELAREISRLDQDIKTARKTSTRFNELSKRLDLNQASGQEQFHERRQEATALLHHLENELKTLDLQRVDLGVAVRNLNEQHQELSCEITSLESRTSNIPSRVLAIRTRMAQVLELDEHDLPFSGELLQVAEEEQAWEGAVERVLHSFGLSLLVEPSLYARVSRYVDKTNLRGRLVYFKVGEIRQTAGRDSDSSLLYNKVRVKPDSCFYEWLDHELCRRFDYQCCDAMESFQRVHKGVTIRGQIKTGGRRHEKNDRSRLDDRSRFVLGWTNKEKIQTLKQQLKQLEQQEHELTDQAAVLEKKRQRLTTDRDNCRDLLQMDDFHALDWQTPARRQAELQEEQRQLEQNSDILLSLRSRLDNTCRLIKEKDADRSGLQGEIGGKKNELQSHETDLSTVEQFRTFRTDPAKEPLIAQLADFQHQVLAEKRLDLRTLDQDQTRVREHLQRLIDNTEKRRKDRENALIKKMSTFRNNWPAETAELDISIESGPAFRQMLNTLKKEDLPRHEARFKELLNEGTINSIALFQGQLERECDDIEAKIQAINRSLRETEYNPGTYIELRAERTQDTDIRRFREELKQCLAHSLGDEELYNEQRFMRVQEVISRFNGREGMVDVDRRWTAKVTDVRNWFIFSAMERWREDDSEKEYYAGSAGKSGGQKEKLAYTILASALAYQFGLEWGEVKSRSFRFVVIDEAFGRGSDESTRYGLELFKRLNLQLLIVTPLQKIHVIENYIHSVHFIHNVDGRDSQIRNLTIEDYREEKKKRMVKSHE